MEGSKSLATYLIVAAVWVILGMVVGWMIRSEIPIWIGVVLGLLNILGWMRSDAIRRRDREGAGLWQSGFSEEKPQARSTVFPDPPRSWSSSNVRLVWDGDFRKFSEIRRHPPKVAGSDERKGPIQ